VQRPADCHFANFDFLKHIPSRQKRGEGRDSCFEMQYHRANPVCGELPVPLTVVTVILDHTEDHLLVAIREVVRCLFTPLEGMVVPPGEIVLTHPDCRDTLQGH
ncbi:hypothetical protein, partial [Escherichia coli]|uniref:hypothetical protein n=4 Tax=Enterobacteriaceae TaxID=543 RepID=UPI003CF815BD